MPTIVNRSNRYQLVTLIDIPESSVDSYGQPSQAPTEIGTYHASVRQLKGRDLLEARQVWPYATHMVEMDWLGSAIPVTASNPAGLILPSMKLLLKKDGLLIRVLYVLWANNVDEMNQTWQLTCTEHPGATS